MPSIRDYPSLTDLPGSARSLLDAAVAHNPFVSATWLEAFERELLAPRERPVYLVLEDQGAAVAVLPLIEQVWPLYGAIRLRGMTNFYTGVYDVVMDGPSDRVAQTRIGTEFATYILRRWRGLALMEFAPIREPGALITPLAEAFAERGCWSRRFRAHGNWHEDVAGDDFESYLARRPGRVRSTLSRKGKKLARERTAEYLYLDRGESMRTHFDAYERVYARSWKTPERSASFIRETMCALADHGRALLAMLYVDQFPAAAQLWVKIGNCWGVFKLAYDPDFSRYSVGTLLTARVVEHLFSRGPFATLDFLSGDDEFKREWMASRRQHWGYEIIPATIAGRLLRLKRLADGVPAPVNHGSD